MNWQYKVVKSQRGIDGKWFAYPAAATFESADEARSYAELFAMNQRAAGVRGTRIDVLSRRKFTGKLGYPTNSIAEYLV